MTAGNSSPITDGACALVLVSAAKAAVLGCPVLAVIRGYGDANQDPEWFTTAPAAVTPKVRQQQTGCSLPANSLFGLGPACSGTSATDKPKLSCWVALVHQMPAVGLMPVTYPGQPLTADGPIHALPLLLFCRCSVPGTCSRWAATG